MRIHQEAFEHPTQTSLVLLNVYEQKVDKDVAAADDQSRGVTGYLLTEDRRGSSNVVATLGFFKTREDAMARVHDRAEELKSQKYRSVPVPSAA